MKRPGYSVYDTILGAAIPDLQQQLCGLHRSLVIGGVYSISMNLATTQKQQVS